MLGYDPDKRVSKTGGDDDIALLIVASVSIALLAYGIMEQDWIINVLALVLLCGLMYWPRRA